MKPLVSVIVAVLNGAASLQRCINSVYEQEFRSVELIIIDGGSTDGTLDILASNNHKITHWESRPDGGIAQAWNRGLEIAGGEWMLFLGSDDYLWNDEVLERVFKHVSNSLWRGRLVYGRIAVVKENGDPILFFGEPWNKAKRSFFQGFSLPHQAVFHHHSLFHVHGKFDESLRIVSDYELMLRELTSEEPRFIDEVVAGMQCGGISGRPEMSLQLLREAAQALRKNGLRANSVVWIWCYLKAGTRVLMVRVFGDRRTRLIGDFYRRLTGRKPYWSRW